MRYTTAAAFRRALEDRLAAIAVETGQSVIRLRKLVAFDRLLARLVAAAPGAWRLKGAVALEYRFGGRSRATMDVDVDIDADRALEEDLLAAQELTLDDWFGFRILRQTGEEDDIPGSARFHVEAELAGRVFERIPLDIAPRSSAFGEDRDVEVLSGPDLLAFAGIEPIRVPVVPLEQHLAEKVHAYTRIYAGGRRSSRPKDLIDLLLIRDRAEISGVTLRMALTATFAERGTHRLPDQLPEPPKDWKPAFERLAEEIGRKVDLTTGYLQAAAFVDPVLEGANPGRWSPLEAAWVAD